MLEIIFLGGIGAIQMYILKRMDSFDERLDGIKAEITALGWRQDSQNRRHIKIDRRESKRD